MNLTQNLVILKLNSKYNFQFWLQGVNDNNKLPESRKNKSKIRPNLS